MKRSKPSSGRGRERSTGRSSGGPKKSFSKTGRFSKSRSDKPFSREKSKDDGERKRAPGRSDARPSRFKRDDSGDTKPRFDRSERSGERKEAFARGTGKPPFKKRTGDVRPSRFKSDSRSGDKRKPFDKRSERPDFRKRTEGEERPAHFDRGERTVRGGRFSRADKPGFAKKTEGDERPSRFERGDRPASAGSFSRGDKPAFAKKREEGEKRPRKTFDKEGDRKFERKPSSRFGAKESGDRPSRESSESADRPYKGKRTFDKDSPRERRDRPWNRKEDHRFYGDKKKPSLPKMSEDGSVRLNKYIANAGICSRREADDLITAGVVSVNGNVVTEMGYKVMPGDVVKYNNAQLRSERLVYILLNKPKDFITTTDDPEDRKTVMSLIAKACKERVYPVGRLDRNTTGVLLFTNDGDLAKTLTHPSFEVHKVYQVELDRPLKHTDMEQIMEGVRLEDGFIKPDEVVYTTPDKDVIGMEIHSGKNRIVRRIFEHLGYEVKKLDRVVFAGLTKKDLPRGRWRFLTEMEVAGLKMMGKGRGVKG